MPRQIMGQDQREPVQQTTQNAAQGGGTEFNSGSGF